jgi:TRAP-type C4-dicarboxylate transport system substrate-binding protein
MRSRRLTLLLSFGLVASLAAASAAPLAAQSPSTAPPDPGASAGAPLGPGALGPGPELTIEWIGQGNPAHLQHTEVDVPWLVEQVPVATGGRVTINLTTRDERGLEGPELVRLLRQGQVDVLNTGVTFLAGDVPLLDGMDLAGLNPTAQQAREVANAMVERLNERLIPLGVRYIAGYPYPAQVFYCREAFTTLADLQGRTIRTFGVTLNDLVTGIGGQPVSIAFPEVYSALERGVVDCGITGTATGNASNWFEVATHQGNLYLSWGTNGLFVNEEWFGGLDTDIQTWLEQLIVDLAQAQTDLTIEITEDGTACNANTDACVRGKPAGERAMTIVEPTDADREFLGTVLTENVIPEWVARCGADCGDIFNEVVAPIAGVTYGG